MAIRRVREKTVVALRVFRDGRSVSLSILVSIHSAFFGNSEIVQGTVFVRSTSFVTVSFRTANAVPRMWAPVPGKVDLRASSVSCTILEILQASQQMGALSVDIALDNTR
jgi:hypothetical protein